MAKKALSVPAVIINNKTLAIVPGSLVYEDGHPEINVRALSSGGGKVESVHTINAENAVSMVKFKLALTDDLDELGAKWKRQVGENVIFFVEKIGQVSVKRVFEGMSFTNKPEKNPSADGSAEFEFKGDQMK